MSKIVRLNISNKIDQFINEVFFDCIEGSTHEVIAESIADDFFKISICFTLDDTVPIDYWELNIVPAFVPSFHWAPHLTPTDQHIISQHSFRSPALIVSDEFKQLVVVPDLDLLSESAVKWYLDMDALRNRLVLGISEYEVDEHVLYIRKAGTVIPAGKLKIGFYIMVSIDENDLYNPWRKVLSFLWEGWGDKLYKSGQPIKRSLDCYVKHTYDWAFDKWYESVWQEFEISGRQVGAPCCIVNITKSPNFPGEMNEREVLSIWNQAWFSSLRSAQGLYRYGKNTSREDLVEKALLTKELALSAPQKKGFFPSVIATRMMHVEKDGKLYNRSKGWKTYYWGNSNRNPFSKGDIQSAPYHVLDMSWTSLMMLNWYSELEADERLKEYALRYADSLLEIQDEDGFFSAWLDKVTLKPVGILDKSPETSLSVTFLLKAFHISREEKYLSSAIKAIKAVIDNIVFQGRWEDFETYWSCCTYGNKELVGRKVERNNMYKQCNFSMYWTAEALFHCYKGTSNKEYLKLGQRCLDEMLMTQASWQPPYMYVNTLGGFGVMNSDGEWNDARQSLFAELIINYGIELNMAEYIQRGLSALRASFVMMYCPENEKTKEQWEKRWSFFNELDYGFMMENYGHGGITNKEGLGIGEFTIYDWGNGAAAEAYMRIVSHFGDEFVNQN